MMKDLEEAAFISFDGEFTGLASERNVMPFDTSEEFYIKQRQTSSGFILIQLGLSFFKSKKDPKDETKEVTTVKSYNIFVYPQPRNATFLCQAQSLTFLATNGFDFGKLFLNGISFCVEKDEDKIRQEMKDKQALRMEQLKQRNTTEEVDTSKRNFIPIPENEVDMVNAASERIKAIIDGKSIDALFDKVNPFQRKLLYELIERDFNNKVSTSVKTLENNRKALYVERKRSEEEDMQREMQRQKEDEIYLLEVIGLRVLLKEISKSKKLIVGHNCLLDLMYLTTQCFDELPADYNDFKTLIHRIFPNVIDTKFIASSEKFKEMFPSSVLNQMQERLAQEPFEKAEHSFETDYHTYSLDFPKEHEAGYDSYLTGYCLLVILKYLKVELSGNFEPSKCKELNPFLNRIALVRIQNPFIYITGKEATFSRAHVFYVKFPATWQTSDVQDHFKNYGPVNIAWVNSTSGFISLYNKENASCVLKTIGRPADFEIQSFAEYQATETERKRDLSRKRKKEDSESSESQPPSNGAAKTPPKDKKKTKKRGKKTFAESDQW